MPTNRFSLSAHIKTISAGIVSAFIALIPVRANAVDSIKLTLGPSGFEFNNSQIDPVRHDIIKMQFTRDGYPTYTAVANPMEGITSVTASSLDLPSLVKNGNLTVPVVVNFATCTDMNISNAVAAKMLSELSGARQWGKAHLVVNGTKIVAPEIKLPDGSSPNVIPQFMATCGTTAEAFTSAASPRALNANPIRAASAQGIQDTVAAPAAPVAVPAAPQQTAAPAAVPGETTAAGQDIIKLDPNGPDAQAQRAEDARQAAIAAAAEKGHRPHVVKPQAHRGSTASASQPLPLPPAFVPPPAVQAPTAQATTIAALTNEHKKDQGLIDKLNDRIDNLLAKMQAKNTTRNAIDAGLGVVIAGLVAALVYALRKNRSGGKPGPDGAENLGAPAAPDNNPGAGGWQKPASLLVRANTAMLGWTNAVANKLSSAGVATVSAGKTAISAVTGMGSRYMGNVKDNGLLVAGLGVTAVKGITSFGKRIIAGPARPEQVKAEPRLGDGFPKVIEPTPIEQPALDSMNDELKRIQQQRLPAAAQAKADVAEQQPVGTKPEMAEAMPLLVKPKKDVIYGDPAPVADATKPARTPKATAKAKTPVEAAWSAVRKEVLAHRKSGAGNVQAIQAKMIAALDVIESSNESETAKLAQLTRYLYNREKALFGQSNEKLLANMIVYGDRLMASSDAKDRTLGEQMAKFVKRNAARDSELRQEARARVTQLKQPQAPALKAA